MGGFFSSYLPIMTGNMQSKLRRRRHFMVL